MHGRVVVDNLMADLQLNYRMEGNGEPLLLVHGFGISFNIWRELAPHLRPHFSLIMIELPGIGKSPMPTNDSYLFESVEAIERLRLKLGFEKWDVLGYSTGSRVAELYTQKYSRYIRRVVFLCPAQLDVIKLASLRFGIWMDGFVPAIGNYILSGWRLKFLIWLFGFNLRRNPMVNEWFAEIGAAPIQVLKDTLRLVASTGRRPFSAPVPFDMIWGDEDIIPAAPRRRGPRDHFVHANHAAPVLAADEVSVLIIKLLTNSGIVP